MFPAVVEKSIDPFAIEAAANYPYDVPNVSVDYLRHEIGINVGYMRSVSHALNCFVAESFMDELATSAGKDPVEFRRTLLARQPRYLRALQLATQEARYGAAPRGHFHGVAVMEGYGTYMAQVAQISLENGKVKVHRIVCAGGLRTGREPGHRHRTGGGLHHIRPHLHALGRDQYSARARAADQLRHLPAVAHERDSAHRCVHPR